MCGIAGIASANLADAGLSEAVRRMTRLVAHRGPDGEGIHEAPGIALGHRRLAIIDLKETGDQPMADPSSRYWLIFNGEIYNYLELRRELIGQGFSFRGDSDSEVLLMAYAAWGRACLERLRGMFAFAIWDAQERRLFAARDRLGIKPFHYTFDGERLCFASEIKALLEFVPSRRAATDLAQQYLAWNILDHDPARTMIEGIHRLPAAHSLTWTAAEGVRIERYWSLSPNDQLHASPEERQRLIEEFREQFATAISLHLRSDVPVGSCLSGGLDSSAIVCMANAELRARDASGRQHSFSAHFPGHPIDETRYIDVVTKATGCQAHFVSPGAEAFLEEVERFLWHQEEPVGGPGPYAQYCVARLAREAGVKVLLDGQGADEQLAGYRKFILVYLRQLARAREIGNVLRNGAAFLGSASILLTSRLTDGRRYLSRKGGDTALWDNGSAPPKPESLGLGSTLAQRSLADLLHFSLPVLLRYEDRNTMAFGIESRVPFVDHVFVEWMARLPADMRLDGGWTKLVMREALRGVLPEPIRKRKSKRGFSAPQEDWLRGPLAPWMLDVLKTPRYLLDVVDEAPLRRIVRAFEDGSRSVSMVNLVSRLAFYEVWARKFLG